jgi:hypothetical protein
MLSVFQELSEATGIPVWELAEVWGERAAIREFDGKQKRAAAESMALLETRQWAMSRVTQGRTNPSRKA